MSVHGKFIGTLNEGHAGATQRAPNPTSLAEMGPKKLENTKDNESIVLKDHKVQNVAETGPNDTQSNNPNNPEVQNLVETGPNNVQEKNVGCCGRMRAFLRENWLALITAGTRLSRCINDLANDDDCGWINDIANDDS